MSNKTLHELAAKSAGIEHLGWNDEMMGLELPSGKFWRPKHNDGDALRLANLCNLSISRRKGLVLVVGDNYVCKQGWYRNDIHSAVRSAIFRAAAEIGDGQP